MENFEGQTSFLWNEKNGRKNLPYQLAKANVLPRLLETFNCGIKGKTKTAYQQSFESHGLSTSNTNIKIIFCLL